ncbi:arginine--tRNA ligase [Candidatus Saccharibacteria bacterium 32-49-12]|nr:MAG: arginine--tRNA ligase [Candidatus Saccharibacteria bacterium 32-49-12]
MKNDIEQIVQSAFGLSVEAIISRPDANFGDYATNIALQLAKSVGQNSRQIAEQIADGLRQTGNYSDVAIAGPGFINVRLSSSRLAAQLIENWSDNYGSSADGAGKTVVVDYPSPNMAKPYSVGHLRPGNQGWAARRLMEETGWRVISDNHLGDYGAPLGIWITGFEMFSDRDRLEANGVYELGRVYIEMKQALKDEKESGGNELADRVQDWLLRYERGDEEALAYSRRFNEISLAHIHHVMDRLGISTDYEMGESQFAESGKLAVNELVEQGVAVRNDDGSVIVPLDGFDVPLLILKSNGAALYATTDLATILYREQNWQPDRVIYAVGAEQQFYFAQLFAMAKKMGLTTEMIHLWFGVIEQRNPDGTREKMSSRKGVVLMEELLDQAEARARRLVGDRPVLEEDIKKIALGAIKFSDFTADRRTNILFDWDSIFALSGFSGPYVQYAAVRVNKILNENGNGTAQLEDYDYQAEKNVLLKLIDYPAVVAGAAAELEPHRIASYLFELAQTMNRYYESTPIATGGVSDVEKQARLNILSRVSHVFGHGLSILGIEIPSSM